MSAGHYVIITRYRHEIFDVLKHIYREFLLLEFQINKPLMYHIFLFVTLKRIVNRGRQDS